MSSGMAATSEQDARKPRRLILWCNPRSGSTALAKCLTNLDEDTDVWFEPFTFSRFTGVHAKKMSNIDLPKELTGNEAIFHGIAQSIQARFPSRPKVNAELLAYGGIKQNLEDSATRTVVVKDMAVAIHDWYDYIPSGFRHVILIRDPRRVVPSFRKMIIDYRKLDPNDNSIDLEEVHPSYPTLNWYGEIYALWKHIREKFEPNPLIIDTEDFLADPATYLRKICELIDVEYRDDLLEWDPSMDAIKKWKHCCIELYTSGVAPDALLFKRAFSSSKFVPTSSPIPSLEDLTPDCVRIIGKCQDLYNEMYQHRFKP
ncbi:uncharacterized protein [Diadema antillarum]|uniref:uncharacterized protein n=1 Tax=Diadema antillarum TaxID=105358 RepID=UPI003A8699E9